MILMMWVSRATWQLIVLKVVVVVAVMMLLMMAALIDLLIVIMMMMMMMVMMMKVMTGTMMMIMMMMMMMTVTTMMIMVVLMTATTTVTILSTHPTFCAVTQIICAVGFPGNLAAILTIATVRPLSPAPFLVALLAASDSAALLVKLVLNQLAIHMTYNDSFCHSRALANVCSTFANWVLVLIAAERLVAVARPVLRSRLLSLRRTYTVCLVVAVCVFAVHGPTMAGRIRSSKKTCEVTAPLTYYVKDVWPWLNTLVYFLLPVCLLFVITTALCVTLRRARRRRRLLLGGGCGADMDGWRTHAVREARRAERALTSMMLAASLLFVLMVLPQCLYFILIYHADTFSHLRDGPLGQLLQQVATVLADSTHALNFYLYFASTRRFRKQFLGLLCCCRTRARRSWRTPLSVTRSSDRKGGIVSGYGGTGTNKALEKVKVFHGNGNNKAVDKMGIVNENGSKTAVDKARIDSGNLRQRAMDRDGSGDSLSTTLDRVGNTDSCSELQGEVRTGVGDRRSKAPDRLESGVSSNQAFNGAGNVAGDTSNNTLNKACVLNRGSSSKTVHKAGNGGGGNSNKTQDRKKDFSLEGKVLDSVGAGDISKRTLPSAGLETEATLEQKGNDDAACQQAETKD